MSTEIKTENTNDTRSYRTEWRSGYRLHIEVHNWGLVLSCETEVANGRGAKYALAAFRVGIVDGTLRGENIRFLRHAFSFYSDALASDAVAALEKFYAELPESTPAPPAPKVPPNGLSN